MHCAGAAPAGALQKFIHGSLCCMGIVRFFFSCITQAIKIAIGVAITIGLFFGAGYLVDMFAAKKTAPPTDPRLKPYADRGMPLTGDAQKDKQTSLYLSFFETLLNKKPDVMPEPPKQQEKKLEAAAVQQPGQSLSSAKDAQIPAESRQVAADPRVRAAQRVAEIKASLSAAAQQQTPASPQTETASAVSEALTYTLQLGSFQNNEVASSFSGSLNAKGYESHIVKITVPDKGVVYRVRLGKYKNLEDAQKAAAELEKKEGISAFITSK
jgi:cell division protein FtsN